MYFISTNVSFGLFIHKKLQQSLSLSLSLVLDQYHDFNFMFINLQSIHLAKVIFINKQL